MKLLITFLSFINFIFGQKFEIELNELTTLDEEVIHVAVLKDKPHKKLILPDNYSDYKFLDLFFDWESGDDKIVSVAILQKDSSDFLFVDFNNDNDLANDGTPIIYSLSENTLSFDVYNLNNNNQKTRLVLSRKPNFPDSDRKSTRLNSSHVRISYAVFCLKKKKKKKKKNKKQKKKKTKKNKNIKYEIIKII